MKTKDKDTKIGMIYSPHMIGGVKIEYCGHQDKMVLKYHTKDGVAVCTYDTASPTEMMMLLTDAIAIAATSVSERD